MALHTDTDRPARLRRYAAAQELQCRIMAALRRRGPWSEPMLAYLCDTTFEEVHDSCSALAYHRQIRPAVNGGWEINGVQY